MCPDDKLTKEKDLRKKPGRIKFYQVSYVVPLERVEAIKKAIELIEQYNTNIKYIYVPKKILEMGDELKNDVGIDTELINHFIEYGKYCELYTYFVKPCNKLILEFYLQTTYNLLEGINEQDPFFITNKEEYRILRNVLRHFEDNFDVLEQQRPVEEIYIHYAVKYLQEVKKTEKGTLAKCITA